MFQLPPFSKKTKTTIIFNIAKNCVLEMLWYHMVNPLILVSTYFVYGEKDCQVLKEEKRDTFKAKNYLIFSQ